ncbi:PepSY-associated TM helix domain-containing protein [Bowmanella dokdonensis]|uniref:PepSY domain-containing protein n=1 Tax=Bowmanella dokdonensis TaxID=751969 RepID=A0A939DJV2_9ALTE|nr:PepSY-associated TM helix domain-containing protein [Bowmanella dokdonensis]MBN7823880.1 PepSY domain-containing protein [Bowmanella dokdonensis]
MDRANWYKVHSWVGLKLAILLCFILVTGTLAVLSHELDWLSNSAMRVDTGSSGPMDWPRVYEMADRHFSGARLTSLSAPPDPWFAAEAVYLDEHGERFRGFFHPVSGEFQGTGRWHNWQRFFRMSHRHLMLPLPLGITLVCLVGLLLTGSLLSGTVIYRHWWRGFFRRPRTTNARVFWGDLHRLAGLWSFWLILIICLTGIWYLIEQWGGRASYPANARPAHQQVFNPVPGQLTRMLSQVAAERPELTLSTIFFPTANRNAVVMEGQARELLVRDRANNMVFDPLDGQLLSSRYGKDLSWHVRISEAADPLHFGTWGGFASKLLYFTFGVVMSALAVIGTYLYGLRASRRTRPGKMGNIWRGMHWGGWLSVLFVVLCLYNTAILFS